MIDIFMVVLLAYVIGFSVTVYTLCRFHSNVGSEIDEKVFWCSLNWMNFWFKFCTSVFDSKFGKKRSN